LPFFVGPFPDFASPIKILPFYYLAASYQMNGDIRPALRLNSAGKWASAMTTA
jgi:hypothetical protein